MEEIMEIKDYCRNVEMELNVWRSKLDDVIRKMDQASTADKKNMFEDINALHILMGELEERIENLRISCPTEWRPDEEDIKVKLGNLESRYNDASNVRVDYDFGG
jgi:chromosome segregation ATPase